MWYWLDDFWDIIDREFGEYKKEIKQELEKLQIYENDDELINFIVEFYSDNNFVRRMKMLCDINKKYPTFFSIYGPYLQNIIPLHYQNYINLIGFEAIGSMKYQEAEIIDYIEKKDKGEETVDFSFLFTIGSKYSKAQIKEMLRKFYEENNITKTPKASDLEQYFNLKTCKVKIDDKWENGFEIISLKEE